MAIFNMTGGGTEELGEMVVVSSTLPPMYLTGSTISIPGEQSTSVEYIPSRQGGGAYAYLTSTPSRDGVIKAGGYQPYSIANTDRVWVNTDGAYAPMTKVVFTDQTMADAVFGEEDRTLHIAFSGNVLLAFDFSSSQSNYFDGTLKEYTATIKRTSGKWEGTVDKGGFSYGVKAGALKWSGYSPREPAVRTYVLGEVRIL